MYPENYRYTKEHEWVRVEGDTGTVGITDHAQQELGDIVYVDFKYGRDTLKAGQQIEQGKTIGSVESVKAVSDIYGEAWLVKIRLSNPGEIANLLSAADYQTYIGAEK